MTDIIDESFGINLRYLQACGLYHPQKLFKLKGILLYFFLNIVLLVLGYVRLFQEPQTLIRTITPSLLTGSTLFAYKLAVFIINNKQIRKCIKFFSHSYFMPRNIVQRKIIMDCVKHCQKISLVYFTGMGVTVAFTLAPGIFKKDFYLPVEIWLPFDYTRSFWVYYTTYFVILLAGYYNCLSGGIIDPLLGGLAYHATSQLKILKNDLESFKAYTNTEDVFKNLKKVKRCVRRHDILLSFVDQYQKCFSTIIFGQLIGTIATTGSLLFSATLFPPGSVDALGFLCAAFCVVFEFFIHSYYGQLLLEETNNVMDAIYLGKWYSYDNQTQKALLIIMERAKTPVILKAGKFWNLTLQNFMKLLCLVTAIKTNKFVDILKLQNSIFETYFITHLVDTTSLYDRGVIFIFMLKMIYSVVTLLQTLN